MKTETKHTPEPWKLDRAGVNVIDPRERAEYVIARCSGATLTESEANAFRIVACVNGCEGIADPSVVRELLEALEYLVQLMESEGKSEFVLGDARAAIAKACGTEGGGK